jgi:aerobic-type carbon monoxide dehydrogenase small subunit (CoxS/CutS family)
MRRACVTSVDFTLDGRPVSVAAAPGMPLLYAIRNDLARNNPHFGCGLAQCGACTVHLDGQALRSCITPLESVRGRAVTTIKGLGTPEKPHPVQQAYIEEQVPQCGYCVNGWIMTAAALLNGNPKATDEQIRDGLAGLKCRCGTHMSIMRAVKRARALLAATTAA